MNGRRHLILGALIGALTGGAFFIGGPALSNLDDDAASLDCVVAYDGKLSLAGVPFTDDVDLRFTLYDDGGASMWQETHSGVAVDDDGAFNVLLGSSTSLASLVSTIARERARHIVTLEDPIEFRIPRGASIVSQRELGVDFESFDQGLRLRFGLRLRRGVCLGVGFRRGGRRLRLRRFGQRRLGRCLRRRLWRGGDHRVVFGLRHQRHFGRGDGRRHVVRKEDPAHKQPEDRARMRAPRDDQSDPFRTVHGHQPHRPLSSPPARRNSGLRHR